MIDCFQIWEMFTGSVNTQQGGAVKPNRNFIHWLNNTSVSLYEEKFVGWEKSSKIIDDLSRPFLKSVNVQIKDVPGSNYGIADYPDDYGHFIVARYYANKDGKGAPLTGLKLYNCQGEECSGKERPDFMDEETWEIMQSQEEAKKIKAGQENMEKYTEYSLDEVQNMHWGAMLRHRLNTATKENPKITRFAGGFKVAPAGVGIIVLDYLKKPTDASFVYDVTPGNPDTGEGDEMVYNQQKSTPLEWSELVINEFLHRLEKKYGKFVREQFIYETGEADRQKTI